MLVIDDVSEDVFEVDVSLPFVGSVAKLVPDENESFLGRDYAGVQVASLLQGALLRADMRDDVCFAFFALAGAVSVGDDPATAFGKNS